jgi:hypothetical protein
VITLLKIELKRLLLKYYLYRYEITEHRGIPHIWFLNKSFRYADEIMEMEFSRL